MTLEEILRESHRPEYDEAAPLTTNEKLYLLEGLQAAVENCAKLHDEVLSEILARIRAKLINILK